MKIFDVFRKKAPTENSAAALTGPVCTDALRQIFTKCSDFECREIYAGGKPVKGLSVCFVDGW